MVYRMMKNCILEMDIVCVAVVVGFGDCQVSEENGQRLTCLCWVLMFGEGLSEKVVRKGFDKQGGCNLSP